MLKDVWFHDHRTVAMHKKMFSEAEIVLAKCLWLRYDEDTSTIYADLETTTDRALASFLGLSFRNFMESSGAAMARTEFFKTVRARYDEIFTHYYDNKLILAPYHEKLYFHQKHGLAAGDKKQFNLWAYEQRTGKTISAATVSVVNNIKKTVIICPAGAKWSAWYKGLTDQLWGFNELNFTILDAAKRRTIKAFQERYIILNYEVIDRFLDYIGDDVGHIIPDECQAIKNASSGKHKAVGRLLAQNPTSRVTFLSGTPVMNRLNDIFAYLKLIGHPLGLNYAAFLRDFTTTATGRGGSVKVNGAKNIDDLRLKLSNFMIRRTQAECLDIPPESHSFLYFELGDYKEEYDKILKELAETKDISNIDASIHTMNRLVSKSKIPGIIEWAEELIELGRKVVIFSGYKDSIKMLEDYFKDRCVKVDGSVHAFDREKLRDRFMKDDDCMVYVGQTLSAVGIDLSIANDVGFCDFPLRPTDIKQAKDRLVKNKKEEKLNIYYTICEDTLDVNLKAMMIDKGTDIDSFMDGKQITDYDNIPSKLLRELVEEYRKKNG